MKTIGIFYGSSDGTTENVANQIAEKLGVQPADVHNVSQASPADLGQYEVLLLGSSTWGAGDLQDDWYDFLPKIKSLDLSDKLVGLFGCGDSSSFSDTFCDAIGTIYQELQGTGCRFIGSMETAGYTFDDVVKTTVFLADMSLFAPMNEVYAAQFTGTFPARSAVAVKELPKGALVEIEVIAVK